MNNEGRLLTDKEIDDALHWSPSWVTDHILGLRKLVKAQLAKDQEHEQARVKRIFQEIEDNFQYYVEGTNDGFIFHKDRWQALKEKEGVK